ncbi:MAG: hypothetical protein LBN25_02390 [Christensenellaceae bacterium]|jgi:hypothetical protein|nr:hypothetical protein [Christensenellaceae bacterium]
MIIATQYKLDFRGTSFDTLDLLGASNLFKFIEVMNKVVNYTPTFITKDVVEKLAADPVFTPLMSKFSAKDTNKAKALIGIILRQVVQLSPLMFAAKSITLEVPKEKGGVEKIDTWEYSRITP